MNHRSSIGRAWTWVPSLFFTEGLPYVVVMTIATIMYKRLGLSNSATAFYSSLLSLPWVIKPLWSPFVDIFSTKRRWIVTMQLLMAASFAAVALVLPGALYFKASLGAFMIVAFLSATHDIAADGFYIIALTERAQSYFVGIRTTLYRAAMIIGQGPLVILAGYLEIRYDSIPHAWATVFYLLATTLSFLAIYHTIVLPHPASDIPHRTSRVSHVWAEFADTFRTFFTKDGIISASLFMLLYKLPEAQLQRMISPFLLDCPASGGMGLSTSQVGMVYGTLGVIGLMAGGIAGGMTVARGGLRKWIMPMAWSMSLTCLTFVLLCYVPSPSLPLINTCVFIEQAGYGFGTTAYILYIIRFSRGARSTSHYAICTGIMSLGMMLPGMAAGWLQQVMGYGPFFIWTMVCCIATIIVAHSVLPRIDS